jgi:N-acetylmuramoyl-L-alanine amidase
MDNDALIAANDEHGMYPTPTAGKRTPPMPNINRSFYENEFNREAKRYFIEDCKRQGLRTFDVKPTGVDVSLSERARRVNNAGANLLVTFAYNAGRDPNNFTGSEGFEVYYSNRNRYPSRSRELAQLIVNYLSQKSIKQVNRGVKEANFYLLRTVNCPSVIVEAGFLTNFREAKLMMDPDFQKEIGEACCQAVCDFLNVPYKKNNPFRYPLLKKGSKGREVRYLQHKLLSKLYYSGLVDEVFGLSTENAVKAFQKEHGLKADGVVGWRTWNLLKRVGGGRN